MYIINEITLNKQISCLHMDNCIIIVHTIMIQVKSAASVPQILKK